MTRLKKLYIGLIDIIEMNYKLKLGSVVIITDSLTTEEQDYEVVAPVSEVKKSDLAKLVEELARENPKRRPLLEYLLHTIHLIKPIFTETFYIEPSIAETKQTQITEFVIHVFQLLQTRAPNKITVNFNGKNIEITGLLNEHLDDGGFLCTTGTLFLAKLFETLFPFLSPLTMISEEFIRQTIKDFFTEHQHIYLKEQYHILLSANETLRLKLQSQTTQNSSLPKTYPYLRGWGSASGGVSGFFSGILPVLTPHKENSSQLGIEDEDAEKEYEIDEISPK